MGEPQVEHRERVGQRLRVAGERRPVGVVGGQQDPARTGDRPPVGERHRQRAERLRVGAAERRVQVAPPGRLPVQAAQLVDHLGERDPAHVQHPQLGAAFQTGRQQAGEDRRQRLDHRAVRALQQRGVPGPQRRGALLDRRRVRQERRPGQPGEHGGAQRVVQRAPAERPGYQAERAEVAAAGAQQLGVGVGGPLGEEVRERAGGHMPAGGVQRVGGDQQRGQVERLVARGGRVQHRGDRRPLRVAPSETGTAQVTVQCGRVRSSVGRSTSSSTSSGPAAPTVCQTVRRSCPSASSVMVTSLISAPVTPPAGAGRAVSGRGPAAERVRCGCRPRSPPRPRPGRAG